MLNTDQAPNLIGSTVYDNDGDKVGKVAQVYLSNSDEQIEWLTVTTGLFGTNETFVPARDATLTDGDVRVPVSKDQVKDAPRIDPEGELSGQEEEQLYRFYGLGGTTAVGNGRQGTDTTSTTTTEAERGADVGTSDTVGAGTSGLAGEDDAMTRSKEELRVGTQQTEAGRARLRKYVTTEQQTATVPVSHEEVRVEREPITDANRGDALDGPEISEDEHEVTLHAEQPVVDTVTTPVERVRLGTETVTEDQQVSGEVREEHIDVDAPGQTDTRGTDQR